MIFIVGLGNPGKKFQKTRHNLGFRVVDEFARKNNFPDFKLLKKFNAEVSEGKINNQRLILAKPQTFMNLSGQSVKKLLNRYRINSAMAELPRRLFIVHDDIDIPLGKIRIVKNRGAAGHKGVQSIIDELRTKDFVRFRIGINPKNSMFYAAVKNVEKSVLQKFNKEEEKILKKIIKKTIEAIEFSLKSKIEKAMQRYNK